MNNPASRRVLEKCGFQWTGVGLYRIRAIAVVGAGRPLPPRPRAVGLAQELGQEHAAVLMAHCGAVPHRQAFAARIPRAQ